MRRKDVCGSRSSRVARRLSYITTLGKVGAAHFRQKCWTQAAAWRARNWFYRISLGSAHRGGRTRGLKPILKPTGRETMQPLANERGGFDLRIDARRRHATSKLESPLPHDLLHPNPNHGGHDAGERVPRLLILPRTSSAKSCSICGGSDGSTLFTCEATLGRAHGGQSLPGAQAGCDRAGARGERGLPVPDSGP
jgi:hypothetical protein